MAADTKKIVLIILYSIIAVGIIVALALLLRIPPKKPQASPVVIQAPVTEPPKNVQEAVSDTSASVPKPDGSGTVISIVFNNQEHPENQQTSAQASEKPATSIAVPPSTAKQAGTGSSSGSGSAGAGTAAPAKPGSQAVKPASSQTTQTKQILYWIQVASFSTKIKAEDMQRKLTEKSLTSYLTSSVVSGKTWYRVRIGPYTSKADAERWLAVIKKIPDCTDAFILVQQ